MTALKFLMVFIKTQIRKLFSFEDFVNYKQYFGNIVIQVLKQSINSLLIMIVFNLYNLRITIFFLFFLRMQIFLIIKRHYSFRRICARIYLKKILFVLNTVSQSYTRTTACYIFISLSVYNCCRYFTAKYINFDHGQGCLQVKLVHNLCLFNKFPF